MRWNADVFRRLARTYNTPYKVQKLIRDLEYNREEHGDTLRSALSALKHETAHCLEAAFVAGAILEHHGYEPLVLSMESQDYLDHVVFVFREQRRGRWRWGAIGRSREEGLHGRAPVFRSLRDLVYSYYDPFIDNTGRITAYGAAHLDESGADWRASARNVWKAEQHLIDLPHKRIYSSEARYRKWFNHFSRTGFTGERQTHWW